MYYLTNFAGVALPVYNRETEMPVVTVNATFNGSVDADAVQKGVTGGVLDALRQVGYR